jgi:ribonucleoside-diphosphate reductase protein NrdI
MIVIVVDSMTGLGKKFADKLGYHVFDIQTYQPKAEDAIVLITRSINLGEIPPLTKTFLDQYAKQVIGVGVGGNRSWGKTFGAAGDKISLTYGIPLILKFEGIGMPHEVTLVQSWLAKRG